MKKKISILFIILALIIVGCSKDKGEFDKTKLEKSSQEIINLINDGDYNKISEDYFDDNMKNVFKVEDFKILIDGLIEKVGEFEKLGKSDFMEQEENGQKFGIIGYEAIHKNGEIVYTLVFNKESKLSGFYVK